VAGRGLVRQEISVIGRSLVDGPSRLSRLRSETEFRPSPRPARIQPVGLTELARGDTFGVGPCDDKFGSDSRTAGPGQSQPRDHSVCRSIARQLEDASCSNRSSDPGFTRPGGSGGTPSYRGLQSAKAGFRKNRSWNHGRVALDRLTV